jgi:hypothetical protein
MDANSGVRGLAGAAAGPLGLAEQPSVAVNRPPRPRQPRFHTTSVAWPCPVGSPFPRAAACIRRAYRRAREKAAGNPGAACSERRFRGAPLDRWSLMMPEYLCLSARESAVPPRRGHIRSREPACEYEGGRNRAHCRHAPGHSWEVAAASTQRPTPPVLRGPSVTAAARLKVDTKEHGGVGLRQIDRHKVGRIGVACPGRPSVGVAAVQRASPWRRSTAPSMRSTVRALHVD